MLVPLNNIEIDYNSLHPSKKLNNIRYKGTIPLSTLINLLLNESQIQINIYKKPIFSFSPNFINLIFPIFDDVKTLMNSGRHLLARNTSDEIFNYCTRYWIGHISKGQLYISKEFWKKLLDIISIWENRNKVNIHKGTPYLFLTHTCLLLDDIENTFIYLSKAIEEDIRTCKKFGQNYQSAPAFSTISLSANQQNFMYPMVTEVRNYLQNHLINYNNNLKKRVKFSTIEKKFFQKKDYYNPMIFLNFLIHLLRIQEDSMEKIHNDFSRIRISNLMFGLCLVIDKTLWIRFQKRNKYVSGNIKSLCVRKRWATSGRYVENIWQSRPKADFESNRTTTFDSIIDDLLDFNLTYGGSNVRKEIQTLLLLWGLRNQGAHRLEKQNILIKRYKDIIQSLFNSFFMSTY